MEHNSIVSHFINLTTFLLLFDIKDKILTIIGAFSNILSDELHFSENGKYLSLHNEPIWEEIFRHFWQYWIFYYFIGLPSTHEGHLKSFEQDLQDLNPKFFQASSIQLTISVVSALRITFTYRSRVLPRIYLRSTFLCVKFRKNFCIKGAKITYNTSNITIDI